MMSRASFLLVLVAVAVCVRWTAPVAPSESEYFLAGHARVTDPSQYPLTIDLPSGWTRSFGEMVKLADQSQKEVGACLRFDNAKGTLAALKSNLWGRDDSQQWRIGELQRGEDLAINLTDDCQGGNVGFVHSHTAVGQDVFSDMDFATALTTGDRVEIVLKEQRTCVLLNAQRAEHPWSEKSLRAIYASSLLASSAWASADQSQATKGALARSAERVGSALYCGEIGKTLRRISPASVDPDHPAIMLAIKAWVVNLKNRDPEKWEAIDFEFTPVLDQSFRNYLARHLGDSVAKDALRGTASEIFEKLIQILSSANGYMASAPNIAFPDIRDTREPIHPSVFLCSQQAAQNMMAPGYVCQLIYYPDAIVGGDTARRSSPQSRIALAQASYDSRTGDATLLDYGGHQRNKYWAIVTDSKKNSVIKGDILINAAQQSWEITGAGSIQSPAYLYVGTLKNGVADGAGRIRIDGKWHKTVAESGRVSVLAD